MNELEDLVHALREVVLLSSDLLNIKQRMDLEHAAVILEILEWRLNDERG